MGKEYEFQILDVNVNAMKKKLKEMKGKQIHKNIEKHKKKELILKKFLMFLQLELFLTLLKRKLTVGKYIALLPIFTFRIQRD